MKKSPLDEIDEIFAEYEKLEEAARAKEPVREVVKDENEGFKELMIAAGVPLPQVTKGSKKADRLTSNHVVDTLPKPFGHQGKD